MSVKFGIEQAGRDAFLAVLHFQDHVAAAPWPYGTRRSCYFARPVKPCAIVGIAMIAFRALGVPHVP